jgi:hypothetical protein
MPSLRELQLLREVSAVASAEAAYKHRQLLSKNKEAARALLAGIQYSTVSYVTEKKHNVNPL